MVEELYSYCESFREVIDPNKQDVFGYSAHTYAMKSKENKEKLLGVLQGHFNSEVKTEFEHPIEVEAQDNKEMFLRVLSFFVPTTLTFFFSILIDNALL